MPRRKKFVKSSKFRRYKARSYKRRYTRRRRIAGRRTRRRRYHMSKKKRSLSKTYGLRKYAGVKWTRYLSLAEFLYDDKWDLNWVYTFGVRPNSEIVSNYVASADFKNFCDDVAGRTFSIFSTDLWSNKTMQLYSGAQDMVYWKAYNPFPCAHNLGPLFNLYTTQYKLMKYVGMKVKWIPIQHNTMQFFPLSTTKVTTKATAPAVPFMRASGFDSTALYTMVNNNEILEETVQPKDGKFKDVDAANTHIIYGDQTKAPIQPMMNTVPIQTLPLRLWVNFDKQGYEGLECKCNCVFGSTLLTNDTNFMNSRIRFARVFNNDGMKTSISNKLVKSYSLLKPFKFYVRPKMALRFQENIENENVASNAEPSTTVIDSGLSQVTSQVDSYISNKKRMPYLSVMRTYPSGGLTYGKWETANANSLAMQIVRALKTDGYFDPILFGWGLSCDQLPLQKQIDFFRVMKIKDPIDYTNLYNHMDTYVTEPNGYEGYGKFKVTYYCRFKDFNPLQNAIVPTHPQFQNAELASEIPQYPVT